MLSGMYSIEIGSYVWISKFPFRTNTMSYASIVIVMTSSDREVMASASDVSGKSSKYAGPHI